MSGRDGFLVGWNGLRRLDNLFFMKAFFLTSDLYGLDYFFVSSTTADISRKSFSDFSLTGERILGQ